MLKKTWNFQNWVGILLYSKTSFQNFKKIGAGGGAQQNNLFFCLTHNKTVKFKSLLFYQNQGVCQSSGCPLNVIRDLCCHHWILGSLCSGRLLMIAIPLMTKEHILN